MHSIILAIELITSILLSLFILIQNKGEGLSEGIAGSGGGGEFYATRRGAEKFIFWTTVVLAVIFTANAIFFAFLP